MEFSRLYDAEGKKRDWYCEDVLTEKLPVRKVFEDGQVVAFHHPYPEAEVHVVVIPKKHVASLLSDGACDGELLASMVRATGVSARALGLETSGFFVRANAATPDVTPHMHWHVTGPGLHPPRVRP